jgi:hypothetical protein
LWLSRVRIVLTGLSDEPEVSSEMIEQREKRDLVAVAHHDSSTLKNPSHGKLISAKCPICGSDVSLTARQAFLVGKIKCPVCHNDLEVLSENPLQLGLFGEGLSEWYKDHIDGGDRKRIRGL